jgi:hypothetical protein
MAGPAILSGATIRSSFCAISAVVATLLLFICIPYFFGEGEAITSGQVLVEGGGSYHFKAVMELQQGRLHHFIWGPSASDYNPKVDPRNGKRWTYRLGDVYGSPAFKIEFTKDLRAVTQLLYPTTIAAHYARRVRPDSKSDARLLANVTSPWCEKHVPKDIHSNYERVVHLRLGDALFHPSADFAPDQPSAYAQKFWQAIKPQPVSPKDLKRNDVAFRHKLKTVVIFGDHKGKYLIDSFRFANQVATLINGTISFTGVADGDFCRMVNAREFIMGKGGFSNTAKDVRDQLGRKTIRPGFIDD